MIRDSNVFTPHLGMNISDTYDDNSLPKTEYFIAQLNGYIESPNPIYRAAINKNSI